MDLATFTRESALNRHAYERARTQIRRDFAGQYVALTQGKVLGAAATFDEALALFKRLDPVPEYYLVFPAEVEADFELAYDLSVRV